MRLQELFPCIDKTDYYDPFFPIFEYLFAHERVLERNIDRISLMGC